MHNVDTGIMIVVNVRRYLHQKIHTRSIVTRRNKTSRHSLNTLLTALNVEPALNDGVLLTLHGMNGRRAYFISRENVARWVKYVAGLCA